MPSPVTELLASARSGDARALERLMEVLYGELKDLARARLRRDSSLTLHTTALVHECFERLRGAAGIRAEDRAQFLAYASRAMRSVVVDHARRRLSLRRGGGVQHLELEEALDGVVDDAQVVRVHEALEELRGHDERLHQVVELRYFGGLTEAEVAQALGLSERTVRRDWEKARLLLYAVMGE